MSGPSLFLELPPRSLFKFPPDEAPPALPPPSHEATFKSPFAIPANVYNDLLNPKVPITIAIIYATIVTVINKYNRNHKNKPWRISQTRPFFAFVVLHNVFLALYSGITFVAMARALYSISPSWDNEHGIVGVVDAYCKMHGPRGFGDAAAFNTDSNVWEIKNKLLKLGQGGVPDSTDVGRLWNEGLAFWGWVFYLSKFYEVLDTFIILAKGKRSSTLQTYHHAGAMLCMWAGIRYMSPPIWMFVTVNSFIHSLMYTYYTLSALGVPVPQALKRTLTSMQITQFVVGVTYAALHLFVGYTVPVDTPYTVVKKAAAAASVVSASASSVSSVVSETAAASLGTYLKKMVFRAAGEAGLAENVGASSSSAAISSSSPAPVAVPSHNIAEQLIYETKHRAEYHRVDCIDTTGQSFAIWLNLLYLFPLTALFVRFFIKSYLRRNTGTKVSTHYQALSKASQDAAKGVEREIDSIGKSIEDSILDKEDHERIKQEVLRDVAEFKKKNAKGFSNGSIDGLKDFVKSKAKQRSAELEREIASDRESFDARVAERLKSAALDDEGYGEKIREGNGLLGDVNSDVGGSEAIYSDGSEADGLSTTNPKKEGTSYADKMKE